VSALVVAEIPALPLHTAGKYVAAAYIVVFAVVLIYVAIMAIRLSHIERDLGELLALTDEEQAGARSADGPRGSGGQAREPQDSSTAARESAPA
jgi:hypothetical protein